MNHEIYICCTSQDMEVANAVRTGIENRGFRCWFAPRDIMAGVDWAEAIVGAIAASKAFVLIYSVAANSSQFVLREVARAVLHHHERFDGLGYPRGLAGDEIPKLSRVVSIIDAYSAMTDDRPYHKGMPKHAALAELRRYAGLQFDPEMVELFARLV